MKLLITRRKGNNKGFSLVELIIVIAIIAILAASMAPALIRYIHKARVAKTIQEARLIRDSIQGGIAQANQQDVDIFLDKEYMGSDGVLHSGYGAITNWNMSRAQSQNTTDIDTQRSNGTYCDYLIAREILKNLAVDDDDPYGFMNFNGTYNNPIGANVDNFYKTYHCPGIILLYDRYGSVCFMEYYNHGVLVRYEFGTFTDVSDHTNFVGKGSPNNGEVCYIKPY